MSDSRPSHPRLRTLGALAVAGAIAAGAALVWFVHAPWLRERMREDRAHRKGRWRQRDREGAEEAP